MKRLFTILIALFAFSFSSMAQGTVFSGEVFSQPGTTDSSLATVSQIDGDAPLIGYDAIATNITTDADVTVDTVRIYNWKKEGHLNSESEGNDTIITFTALFSIVTVSTGTSGFLEFNLPLLNNQDSRLVSFSYYFVPRPTLDPPNKINVRPTGSNVENIYSNGNVRCDFDNYEDTDEEFDMIVTYQLIVREDDNQ